MIDQRLYRETFSRLCASEEAKREVLQMIGNSDAKHTRRLPRILRAGVIAAAMTMALAVTAGAVNLATGGEFFQTLRMVWSDGYETRYEAVDPQGNPMEISVIQGALIRETEEGRLILCAAGEETDVTDDLRNAGEARFEKTSDRRTVQVTVTGTPEDWVLEETVTESDGTVYNTRYTSDEASGDVTVSMSGVTVEGEEIGEDGSVKSGAVTVTGGGEDGLAVETARSAEIPGAAKP